jgi:hypothetical protein
MGDQTLTRVLFRLFSCLSERHEIIPNSDKIYIPKIAANRIFFLIRFYQDTAKIRLLPVRAILDTLFYFNKINRGSRGLNDWPLSSGMGLLQSFN